ncbi:MAG: hypothetical protein JSR98_09325 [Proteobacteria bacterium]|nr:hypothetical protein [Pseudomonadota bacterium]
MPTYRLYPLTPAGAPQDPVEIATYDDSAAMRWAMRQTFAFGCDIFLAGRFVARVHRPQAATESAFDQRPSPV